VPIHPSLFDGIPTYDRYRTLRLVAPELGGPLIGEDVYALQVALQEIDIAVGGLDGVLGRKTSEGIREAQESLDGFMGIHLVVDGLAGGWTQQAIARLIIRDVTREYDIAQGAGRGQIEHESGFRLGNYSPPRPAGDYDAGVAQRNTQFTPPEQGFDTAASISALARHLKAYYRLYDGIKDERLRWSIAQGSWNAPAYAAWLADDAGATSIPNSPPGWWPKDVGYVGKSRSRPGSIATATLQAYIASVSAYLKP